MGTLGNAVFTNSPSSPSLTGICVHTLTLCDWSAYIGEQNLPPSPTKCILSYTPFTYCGSCSSDLVVYISSQATRPIHLYEESSYEVWRRYRDFEWLRAQVERSHPTLILPVSHSVAR